MATSSTLLYLLVIIAAARVAGELAERVRQPALLGEMAAGVLLGMTPLRTAAEDSAIVLLASIGVILLLFETGLESDLAELMEVGRSAALVAVIGVALPFLAAFGLVLVVRGDYRQALFIGAVLTATSVGVTARVLADLGQTASREARIILGAAVIDDILGLLVLALVLQISVTGRPDALAIVKAAGFAVFFLAAAVWLGVRMAPKLISLAHGLKTRGMLVSVVFLFCIGLAHVAKCIGLAEVVGAFAAGLVLATTEDKVEIHKQIRPVTDVFIPVFFVLVGLQVSLGAMNPADPSRRGALLLGVALVALAVLGKLASGLGAVAQDVNRFAIGIGMVPRGEVGLILASIGLKEGILSPDLYAQAILVVFVSALIAPAWLKRVFPARRALRIGSPERGSGDQLACTPVKAAPACPETRSPSGAP